MTRFMFQKDDETEVSTTPIATPAPAPASATGAKPAKRLNDNDYEVKRVTINCAVLGFDLGTTGSKVAFTSKSYPNLVKDLTIGYVKEVDVDAVRGLRNDLDFDLGFSDDFGFGSTNTTSNVEDNLAFEWGGKGWLVGNAAAENGAELGVGRSKTEYAVVKLIATCIKFGITGEVAVGLAIRFIDQQQFGLDQSVLVDQLEGKTLNWRYMGEPGSIFIPKGYLSVMPEGFAAVPYCLDQGVELQGKNTLLFDLGETSLDLSLADGTKGLNFNRHISGSLDSCGVHQFIEEIVNAEGLPSSNSHLLLAAIATGKSVYSYTDSNNRIKEVDLNKVMPGHKDTYCKKLQANVFNWLREKQVVERVDDIVIFGGGGYMFYQELSAWFKGKNVILLEPPRFANACGLHALMKKRVAKVLLEA